MSEDAACVNVLKMQEKATGSRWIDMALELMNLCKWDYLCTSTYSKFMVVYFFKEAYEVFLCMHEYLYLLFMFKKVKVLRLLSHHVFTLHSYTLISFSMS